MPLSERTLAEMRAGAEQVARNQGKALSEGWLEKVIATQERMKALKIWEKEGKCDIEWCSRLQQRNGQISVTFTVVRVGDNVFNDIPAEEAGAFPSEVLIAQVALAIGAGEHLAQNRRTNANHPMDCSCEECW